MEYSLQKLGLELQKTRKKKGLSQKALGELIGIPQSHLSKIESGLVNLQASSLMEIARALELEMMLVPRYLVPALQALEQGVHETPRPMYYPDEEE